MLGKADLSHPNLASQPARQTNSQSHANTDLESRFWECVSYTDRLVSRGAEREEKKSRSVECSRIIPRFWVHFSVRGDGYITLGIHDLCVGLGIYWVM